MRYMSVKGHDYFMALLKTNQFTDNRLPLIILGYALVLMPTV
jgi:hypothetical protein